MLMFLVHMSFKHLKSGHVFMVLQVHPEGKFVVDIDKNIDMNSVTPNCRVALRNDSYVLHKILPNKVRTKWRFSFYLLLWSAGERAQQYKTLWFLTCMENCRSLCEWSVLVCQSHWCRFLVGEQDHILFQDPTSDIDKQKYTALHFQPKSCLQCVC